MTDSMVRQQSGERTKRSLAVICVAALSMLLAACILMPGKFTSSLDLRKDGRFTFAYKGEIHFVSPQDVKDSEDKGEASFEPDPCLTEAGEMRDCTAAEIAEQKREREARKKESREAEKAQMAAMTGSEDLADPKTAEEFARKLARQKGWRSVKSMGNVRFDVDYAISGTLTHEFTFPVMEDFPLANPFVQVIPRADDTVRIVAPGFSSGAGGSPLRALAQMGESEPTSKEKKAAPRLPKMDGTFTLVTDSTILANNTDEGPVKGTTGEQLTWMVNDRTKAPPAALVRLGE